MEDAGHAGLKSEVFLSHFIVKVTETASNLFSMLHATIIQPWFNGPHAGVKKKLFTASCQSRVSVNWISLC